MLEEKDLVGQCTEDFESSTLYEEKAGGGQLLFKEKTCRKLVINCLLI